MSSIFLIYENKTMNSAATSKQHAINLIKSKFEKENLSNIKIEQFSLNDMYNHSKEKEYSINSDYQLQEIRNYA